MRLIVAFIFSAVVVMGLLLGMSQMVVAKEYKKGKDTPDANWLVNINESDLKVKERPKREKKEVPKPQPDPKPASKKPPKPTKVVLVDIGTAGPSLPPFSVPDIPMSPGTDFSSMGESTSLTPKVQIAPEYPMIARKKGLQGWVKLSFDVNEEGYTTNVRVVESEPKRIFDKAAIRALKKWKYSPEKEEGKGVYMSGQQVTLEFNLEGNA
ncbi:energy transducer TonB [Pleionea sp. CnH1-48]|uniref:energy transducer TonB n=1 Tax=Pleionea sp. CnH1-48 TaxID=2954494 RepID=UPI002097F8F3|nr:energy transducer TonB [Pleionea sp. CnH1-48]MCO7226426.1 TonB family protein [Pleionea sp. CnH1-48]